MTRLLTIGSRFQGIPGIGQGGHLGGILAEDLGGVVRTRFISPIPLERGLVITRTERALVVWDGDTEVAAAAPATIETPPPPPVTAEEAAAGRDWAKERFLDKVATCFSCGSGARSFGVHAGLVPDRDRFATPFRPPRWTAGENGAVRLRYLWAPLDCAAGWRVSLDDDSRLAVTGWLTVEVLAAVEPEISLVLVADAEPGWSGRKRMAWSALYTATGTLLARAESLWIALDRS